MSRIWEEKAFFLVTLIWLILLVVHGRNMDLDVIKKKLTLYTDPLL